MIAIKNYDGALVADLWQVYFTAIHMVCIRDYTKHQVEAWAPENFSLEMFAQKMDTIKPFIATSQGNIVGYADLQPDGLIDHFFVHGEYQSQGIGKALMNTILGNATGKEKLYSHVSHTAKPFYLRFGFTVEKIKIEEIHGCKLENNFMVKKP